VSHLKRPGKPNSMPVGQARSSRTPYPENKKQDFSAGIGVELGGPRVRCGEVQMLHTVPIFVHTLLIDQISRPKAFLH
jgi:hypothetical protein